MGSRRTGVPAMMDVGRRLCTLIVKFQPIIMAVYPTNTAVQTALSAALAACQALHDELMAIRDFGD